MSEHPESTQSTDEDYPSLWKNPNFVRFLTGEFVTNVGDSLYTIAILWLVHRLSGSTVLTGVASALLLLPWLLQFIAGPIIDRFQIKRVLVWAQFIQAVAILAIPAAAHTGNLSVGLVFFVIPVLSVMSLILSPVQAALVPRIVAEHRLSKGNSALATVTLGLDMVFQAAGGVLIAVFGAMALFVSDSATFVVSGVLFYGMVVPTAGGSETSEESVESDSWGYIDDLREGIDILRGTVFVDMVFTSAVFNFATGVTLAILPAFGALHGGPILYGLMLGALGVGRMIGSMSASYLDGLPYGKMTVVTYLCSAVLWVGSVYSSSKILTVGLFAFAWIAAGIDGVLIATLNQKVFSDEILGRVSSLKGTASGATLPLGSLVGGVIAELVGTTTTMGLAAVGVGFVGAYFALRPSLRNIPAVRDVTPADFDVHNPDESRIEGVEE